MEPPLTPQQRLELKDRFWTWIPNDISGYSKAIVDLLNTLTDEQLMQFVLERVEDDED